jgi:hypothetical protein
MARTLRVQAEHERPANRIHPLRARRKMAEALEAAMPQFDAQESRVLPPKFPGARGGEGGAGREFRKVN